MKIKLTEEEIRTAIEIEIKDSLEDGGYYEPYDNDDDDGELYGDICIQQQITDSVVDELYDDEMEDNDNNDYWYVLRGEINSWLDEYEDDLDKINEILKKKAV